MGDDKAEVDRVFHALGDPTRRRILKMLSERPHSVKGLAGPLGITHRRRPAIAVARKSRLGRYRKIGRVRTCQMIRQGLAAGGRWIEACRPIWSRRLDRLGF